MTVPSSQGTASGNCSKRKCLFKLGPSLPRVWFLGGCKAGSQVLPQPGRWGLHPIGSERSGLGRGSPTPGQLGLASDSVTHGPLISQEMMSQLLPISKWKHGIPELKEFTHFTGGFRGLGLFRGPGVFGRGVSPGWLSERGSWRGCGQGRMFSLWYWSPGKHMNPRESTPPGRSRGQCWGVAARRRSRADSPSKALILQLRSGPEGGGVCTRLTVELRAGKGLVRLPGHPALYPCPPRGSAQRRCLDLW